MDRYIHRLLKERLTELEQRRPRIQQVVRQDEVELHEAKEELAQLDTEVAALKAALATAHEAVA